MKKIIFITLMTMVLMVGLAQAAFYPMPINGKLEGFNMAGLTVKITNHRTTASMTVNANNAGEWGVDWQNSPYIGYLSKYDNGDTYTVRVLECIDEPECTQTMTWDGKTFEVHFNMDLSDVRLPGTTCDSCCPEDYTPYTEEDCIDIIACEEKTCECEGDLLGYLLAGIIAVGAVGQYFLRKKFTREELDSFLGAIGAGMKGATGVKITKFKNRDEVYITKAVHVHPGRSGYHDPFTSHRNEAAKHESGKVFLEEVEDAS